MAITYVPPGVTVRELTSPSVNPLLGIPALICLVGLATGVQTRTDAVTLVGTTATTLPGVPADATMVSGSIAAGGVMDAINPSLAPSGYVVTTDYTFNATNHTITRVGGGTIPDGNTVYVTYTYTPADYYQPILLDSMSDIQDRFGTAWDSTGTSINSPLSHAALLAFENGAQEVVLQPLFFNNSGVKQQPTSVQAAASATWADNFFNIRSLEDINIIVPVVGQSQANVNDAAMLAIAQTMQDHIKFMKTSEQQYIIGVWGEDSSASNLVATKPTLTTHADTIAARYASEVTQQMVMVSPAKYTRPQPGTVADIYIGGQYVAAGIAGAIAARDVSQTLTRKAISGFRFIAETRSKAEKNADASHGMMVMDQKGGLVQVRHAVTMDTTATIKRELSIVRAKHRVIESVRDTLETQIIGQVVADGGAPLLVSQAVIGVLEALRSLRDIVSFSDVQSRTLTLDPTHIETRFSYRPAFPVNYITVLFSLDLTTGQIQLPNTSNVNSVTSG